MKINFLFITAIFVLSMTLMLLTAEAKSIEQVPAKEAALIAHLIREANHTGANSKRDAYLLVTIGKTAYTAALASGKVVSQMNTDAASGGFFGIYVEVSINLLDKNKNETAQGSGQILKFSGGKWKRVALSEGDYQCTDVRSIPKSTLKALKVECN